MIEIVNLLQDIELTLYVVAWLGIALASCGAGVLFYRLVSNRLAGFIYRLGRS